MAWTTALKARNGPGIGAVPPAEQDCSQALASWPIPGLGPVVAVVFCLDSPGAVAGAATGGVIGALTRQACRTKPQFMSKVFAAAERC
jgi:hypothetical protein